MSNVLRTPRLTLLCATPEQVHALIDDDYARASQLIGAERLTKPA